MTKRQRPIRISKKDRELFAKLTKNTKAKVNARKKYGVDLTGVADLRSLESFQTRSEFNDWLDYQRKLSYNPNFKITNVELKTDKGKSLGRVSKRTFNEAYREAKKQVSAEGVKQITKGDNPRYRNKQGAAETFNQIINNIIRTNKNRKDWEANQKLLSGQPSKIQEKQLAEERAKRGEREIKPQASEPPKKFKFGQASENKLYRMRKENDETIEYNKSESMMISKNQSILSDLKDLHGDKDLFRDLEMLNPYQVADFINYLGSDGLWVAYGSDGETNEEEEKKIRKAYDKTKEKFDIWKEDLKDSYLIGRDGVPDNQPILQTSQKEASKQ